MVAVTGGGPLHLGWWTSARVSALGTVLVASGVIFTGLQVLGTRKQRAIEIARSLVDQWESKELVEARILLRPAESGTDEAVAYLKAAVKKAHDTVPPADEYYQYTRFLSFFEELGVAFARHRQGLGVVNQLFGGTVMDWWETWEQVIPTVWGTPKKSTSVGENFYVLYLRLRRYRRRLRWRRAVRHLPGSICRSPRSIWRYLSTPQGVSAATDRPESGP